VIAVVVVVLLVGSAATYVQSQTSAPPAGPGICSTACAMWVKIDCPGSKILGTCAFDRPIVPCGAPLHPCGSNPPPPP
jgi:hypothetical protein